LGNPSWVSYAALTEGVHVRYADNKRITLLGDYHTAGTDSENQKQTESFFELLAQFAQHNPLHVFLEQAGDLVQSSCALRVLKEQVQKANSQGLTIEDTELRRRSITANHVLRHGLSASRRDIKFFNDSLSLSKISFGHIDEEFGELVDSAKAFKEQNQNLNFANYNWKLPLAINNYKDFCTLRSSLGIVPEDRVWDVICTGKISPDQRFEMTERIGDAMSQLIELYLFKRIYEYPGTYIAVVVGASHVQNIEQLLYDQGATISFSCYCKYSKNEEPIILSSKQIQSLVEASPCVLMVKKLLPNGSNPIAISSLAEDPSKK